MSIVVQKYGGSSLADIDKIKKVAERIVNTKKQGHQVVAIVSAMGKTTDQLIALTYEISQDPPKREMDRLLSTGEQVSMSLLAMAIQAMGENAVSLTGPQAGIKTDSTHSRAKIVRIVSHRLQKELEDDNIIIIAGFQGESEDHDVTTLGRGGSDTSAVSIAAALKASLCEIFTDVDGVYAADPRLVPNAKKLVELSYDEMLEMAILGAKVLQPRAVEMAKAHGVHLHVRSSFNHNIGTIIKEDPSMMERDGIITGIAHDFNVAKVVVFGVPDKPGIASSIFKLLADHKINIQMIVQSAEIGNRNDIAFTCPLQDAKDALKILSEEKASIGAERIAITEGLAKVSIIGAGMFSNPGIAASMFDALAQSGVNIDMISTSDITLSVIIQSEDCEKAVKALADVFALTE